MKFSNNLSRLIKIPLGIILCVWLILLSPSYIVWGKHAIKDTITYIEKIFEHNKEIADDNTPPSLPMHQSITKIPDNTEQVNTAPNENDINNSYINKIIRQSTLPALITLEIHRFDLGACNNESKEVLFALLQYELAYTMLMSGQQKIDNNQLTYLAANYSNDTHKIHSDKAFIYMPLVNELLKYHKKITDINNWEEIFFEFSTKSYQPNWLISDFYANDFPKTNNSCFSEPLSLTVNDGYSINSQLAGISLEEWLYTFWLNRFQENDFDTTYNTLETVAHLPISLGSINLETFVTMGPMTEKSAGDITKDSKIIKDTYKDIIYGFQSYKSEIQIPGNPVENISPVEYIYPLVDQENNGPLKFKEIQKSTINDDKIRIYWHHYTYDSQSKSLTQSALYTTSKHNIEKFIYKPISVSDETKSKIYSALNTYYGHSEWDGRNTLQHHIHCIKNPGITLTGFKRENEYIYFLKSQCSIGGDQNPILLINAIIKQQGETLAIIEATRGAPDMLQIDQGFIADLDNDGNIETLVNMANEAGTSLILVEFKKDDFNFFRWIHFQGGDGEEYEQNLNTKLLYPTAQH